MKALMKKELRSYLYSVTGALFVAANLLFMGLYFSGYNLNAGYPSVNYTINSAITIFLFITPLLTMRIIAQEQALKTDQLLYTSPMPIMKIVMGKYLALLTIFIIPVIAAGVYPLILSLFGKVNYGESYVAILAYFLFGAACIAIGLFISSLTENQIIAAVLTFAALFITFLMSAVTSLISREGNLLTRILSLFDMAKRLDNFMNGILDIRAVVYYLTVVVIAIFLTYENIQRRRFSVSSKTVRLSAYSLTAVVIAFALAVGVNYLVLRLPDNYMQFDLTHNKMYSMSREAGEYLQGLDKDVTIYSTLEKDSMDTPVVKTLDQFEDCSKHIRVEYMDITKNPQFASKYTDETLSPGDLLVVGEDEAKAVSSESMFVTEMDYQTFSETVTGIDIEGQIISAISYVNDNNKIKMKTVQGHGEFTMSELGQLDKALKKLNMEIEEISLLSTEKIDDCDILLIAAPMTDYTKEDCEKVSEYLENGGKAVILTGYSEEGEEFTNFYGILEKYGVSLSSGLIIDPDANSYYGSNPLYLLPQVQNTPASKTAYSQGRYVFMPYSQAIYVEGDDRTGSEEDKEDTDEGESQTLANTEDILVTSSASFIREDMDQNADLTKKDGDESGPFRVGAYITSADTKIALFSSALAFSDDAYQVVGDANVSLVLDAARDMSPVATGPSIPVKNYKMDYITVPVAFVILYSLVFTVLLPVIILVLGIVLWARRRKR